MEKFKCRKKSDKQIYRAQKEDSGEIFVFLKGSTRYGHRMSQDWFDIEYVPIQTRVSQNQKWHRRLKRAVACMDKSGLWEDIKKDFQKLLDITWEEHEAMRAVFWKKATADDEALVDGVRKRYPEMFNPTDGMPYMEWIAERSDCILKSMYFGKFDNRRVKDAFAQHLKDKTPYTEYRLRTSYDVTLEYVPEKAMAWYSEEYIGCGNGHYYVALDNNTALFVEDD